MTKDDKWIMTTAVQLVYYIMYTNIYVYKECFIHRPMSTCPEPTENLFVSMKKKRKIGSLQKNE